MWVVLKKKSSGRKVLWEFVIGDPDLVMVSEKILLAKSSERGRKCIEALYGHRQVFQVVLVVRNLPANVGDTRVWCLGGEHTLCRKWQPTPVFLPEKSQEQRSLAGYSLWSCRVGHHWATEYVCVGITLLQSLKWSQSLRVLITQLYLCVCMHTRVHTHIHGHRQSKPRYQEGPRSLAWRRQRQTWG